MVRFRVGGVNVGRVFQEGGKIQLLGRWYEDMGGISLDVVLL